MSDQSHQTGNMFPHVRLPHVPHLENVLRVPLRALKASGLLISVFSELLG